MTPEQAIQKLSQELKTKTLVDKSDPYSIFRGAEKWNICSIETSMLTRMADLMSRIVKNQTPEDLIDLAGISVMLASYVSDDDNATPPKEEPVKQKRLRKKPEVTVGDDGQEYTDA